MIAEIAELESKAQEKIKAYTEDWCFFAREFLGVNLDPEQEEILRSVQVNKMTSVASGTSRGKDFVAAVSCLCFLYLTPLWDENGVMIENTKVAMSAPTERQIENIMTPEITRLFNNAKTKLPGRLVGHDIRTMYKEWFLTGFKADNTNTEAWSGFHAANTMFVVTEASGIPDSVFDAIEGNLQGNSRILIVFNPNTPIGYAAKSQRSPRWNKFRLDSLTAPNVLHKKNIIPGQVDYDWVVDKVKTWCMAIPETEFLESEGDFTFAIDGIKKTYRPNDLFRAKVRGLFPKVSEDTLIPLYWVQLANERWLKSEKKEKKHLRLGIDVAGMGRDSSVYSFRYENRVERFESVQSGGEPNHMEIAGKTVSYLNRGVKGKAFIDTIGEGAGVYSRLVELNIKDVFSVKFSASGKWNDEPLKDITDVYEFLNMRAYLYWCLRDWLNPAHKFNAELPPDDELTQELTEIKYKFRSDGKIQIEPKEEIHKRLKRSPDKSDSLANTFYPVPDETPDISTQAAEFAKRLF
jgi:hypothetical protein